jgi:hypothetical protein
MGPRLASNLPSSCLSLPSVGITGVPHRPGSKKGFKEVNVSHRVNMIQFFKEDCDKVYVTGNLPL